MYCNKVNTLQYHVLAIENRAKSFARKLWVKIALKIYTVLL